MHHHHPIESQGPVVVNIGGDVGALVLRTRPEMELVEIEISPVGDDARRSHVAVLARPGPRGTVHAAVYPALYEGEHRLWRPDGTPAGTVHVTGGKVTEAHWSDLEHG